MLIQNFIKELACASEQCCIAYLVSNSAEHEREWFFVRFSIRLKLVILFVLLLFFSTDRQCEGYYAIPNYDDADDLFLSAIKSHHKSPVATYGLYNNFNEWPSHKPNMSIFAPTSIYFVPYDRVQIDVPVKFNFNIDKGDQSNIEDRLWADIELRNTYEEYRKIQQKPHELLKGLSVSAFDRPKKDFGALIPENKPLPTVSNLATRSGKKLESEGSAIQNVFTPNESSQFSHSMQQRTGMTMQETLNIKHVEKEQEDNGGIKKKSILTTKNNKKKEIGNKRWVVMALIKLQKFISSNPRILIIFSLISALLISLIYSNICRK